ncbi:unnamed protein product [Schistosoma rodhaini]|uniref:G-protein coupled receptors family 1 profile domain-containing protein n=1 Tax=Schistosoma rodhaini TaxID=6188 RepID=A0AA85F440_9TREM|nr:unnamed protein product [Schistosoma rodhaini]
MCDYQSGFVYQYENTTDITTQMDVVIILFSCCIIFMNPFTLFLVFQIYLSSSLVSFLIMIQITFDTLVCVSQIGNKFCPFLRITPQMWINILICHIWTNEFLNNLFNTFTKQSILAIIIEHCLSIYKPNVNLLNYPKLLGGIYCFSVAYNIVTNLYLILLVKIDQIGHCVINSNMLISSIDRLDLVIFGYVSLILGDIIPFIVMIIILILVILHQYKRKVNVRDQAQIKPVQKYLTLLIIVWCLPEILITLLDMFQHVCEAYIEYEMVCDISHHCLEILRSITFMLHSISLFIFLKPMGIEALKTFKNISQVFKTIFHRN